MEELTERTQQVIESLTENEALTDNLDDAGARLLLDWGIAYGKWVVQSTAHLAKEAANGAMEPRLQAIRRLLRTVNQHFASSTSDTAQTDTVANQTLLRAVLEQAAMIWGPGFSAPDDQQLTAFSAQLANAAQTPATLIAALRNFVDQHQGAQQPPTMPPQNAPGKDAPEKRVVTPQPLSTHLPWIKRLFTQLRRFYPQPKQID